MNKYNTDCYETMTAITDIFPIEVDLPSTLLKTEKYIECDDDEFRNIDEIDEKKEYFTDERNIVNDLIKIEN
jgi:hypothetical protein